MNRFYAVSYISHLSKNKPTYYVYGKFDQSGLRGCFILLNDINHYKNGSISRCTGLWSFEELGYVKVVTNERLLLKLSKIFGV